MTLNNNRIEIAETISIIKIRIMIRKYISQSLGVRKIMIANNNNKIITNRISHKLLGVIKVSKKKTITKIIIIPKIIIQVGVTKIIKTKIIIKTNSNKIDKQMIEIAITTIETTNKITKETLIMTILVITIETTLTTTITDKTTTGIIITIRIMIETSIKTIMNDDNSTTTEIIIKEIIINRITIITNHGTIKSPAMMITIIAINIKSLYKTHGKKITIMKMNRLNKQITLGLKKNRMITIIRLVQTGLIRAIIKLTMKTIKASKKILKIMLKKNSHKSKLLGAQKLLMLVIRMVFRKVVQTLTKAGKSKKKLIKNKSIIQLKTIHK